MALNIYADEATTSEVLSNEVFTNFSTGINYCDGTNKVFQLSLIPDVSLVSSVYLETRTLHPTAVTFNNGVSSNLGSTLAVDSLNGQRVIHNGEFRGIVLSNTTTTITLDRSYTESVASSCITSTYVKQTHAQYSVSEPVTITFVTAPSASCYVHVIPINDVGLSFGGDSGSQVTSSGSVWLKRDPGYEYRNLKVYSQDNSVIDHITSTFTGIESSGATSTGFGPMTQNQYAGYAAWINGQFAGMVVSNTTTGSLTLDRSFTCTNGIAQLFDVGPMELSLDGSTWDKVVVPADATTNTVGQITTDAPVRIYFRDTLKIPNIPTNYPNVILKVSGTEYLSA